MGDEKEHESGPIVYRAQELTTDHGNGGVEEIFTINKKTAVV